MFCESNFLINSILSYESMNESLKVNDKIKKILLSIFYLLSFFLYIREVKVKVNDKISEGFQREFLKEF